MSLSEWIPLRNSSPVYIGYPFGPFSYHPYRLESGCILDSLYEKLQGHLDLEDVLVCHIVGLIFPLSENEQKIITLGLFEPHL